MDEDDVHENNYEVEILHRYRWLIRDRVGHDREAYPDVKNIRVSPPEKYAGEGDIEIFDTWLAGLLRWLWYIIRLSTSPGYPQLTTGIPVGFPTGMETRGSELPVITGLRGSGCLFWVLQVLATSTCETKIF